MTPTLAPEPKVTTQPENAQAQYRRAAERPPQWWGIGRLAPLLIATWLLVDAVPRFLPLDWLRLNPWQVAQRQPGRHSPFHADLQSLRWTYIGGEAIVGNLPPTETRSPVVFSTDHLGFRATPPVAPSPPAVFTFGGYSYSFGACLSDDETFPAQLSRLLGVNVYNAGRFQRDPEGLAEMDSLLSNLGHSPRLAIHIYADGAEYRDTGAPSDNRTGSGAFATLADQYQFAKRYMRGWRRISPLEIVSVRLYKSFCDDRILPNPYKHLVEAVSLSDNRRFLFRKHHLRQYLTPDDDVAVRDRADFIVGWRDRLKEQSIALIVLLIPTKASLYASRLLPHLGTPQGEPFIDRFARELQRRGLPVINGLSELTPQAAHDVAHADWAFFREDEHWTPSGVARLARAVAETVRRGGFLGADAPPELSTANRTR